MFIYYVYAYLRLDSSPYYIGKGKGNRAFSKNHNVHVPIDRNRVLFLETNLSNIGALALERRYIRWYGRKDNNTGILRNLTDGGDGAAGEDNPMYESKRFGKLNPFFGKKHTEETKTKIRRKSSLRVISEDTRIKMSNSQRGRKHSPETIEKMKNKDKSDYTKQALSNALKNKPKSGTHKQSMRKPKSNTANMGKYERTEAIRQKLRAANLGKKRKPHSSETKQKIREAALRRNQSVINTSSM